MKLNWIGAALLGLGLTGTQAAHAADGKLLLTGGVSSIDGAAGGGLTPWALTGSYANPGEVGGTAFATRVQTQDYALNDYGAALTVSDRVELSIARQEFDTQNAGAALGLGAGFKFKQNIIGVKVRLAGDAVLDSDSWMPQISAGVLYKHNEQGNVVRLVGAKDDTGTDFYVSATKLFLGQGLLVNGTLRATKANQNGLLGFGGDRNNSYSFEPEVSVAYLLRKDVAVGAEYRAKPNNLGFAREQDWNDVFVAWAPSKHLSITAAYANLGDIATFKNQRGWYLSAQLAI